MHATTITTLLLALEALAVPLRSEHALVSNGTVHRAGDGPQPNLIFMLMDDYGYNNIGYHARNVDDAELHASTITPALDSLADDGIKLERLYAYKVCGPSRAAIQTGRLPMHVNYINKGVLFGKPDNPVSGLSGIPSKMTGIAERLRTAGYKTHGVGKWDVGMQSPESTPKGKGYDTFLGFHGHACDHWAKTSGLTATGELDECLNQNYDMFFESPEYNGLYNGAEGFLTKDCMSDPGPFPICFQDQAFLDRSIDVVKAHDTKDPLFFFLSWGLLHTPLQVPVYWKNAVQKALTDKGLPTIDSTVRHKYMAMVAYVDALSGQFVEAIKAKPGMWDNTLFFFMSDNGGPTYEPGGANNYPLRGGKLNDFEGGLRVNAFLAGGFLPAAKRGTEYHGLMSSSDVPTTFCTLAGMSVEQCTSDTKAEEANVWLKQQGLEELPGVDGKAQWEHIVKDEPTAWQKETLHLSESALMKWPYKLIIADFPTPQNYGVGAKDAQPYGHHTGPLYPNCSTVRDYVKQGLGPYRADFRVYGYGIPYTTNSTLYGITSFAQVGPFLFNVEKDEAEEHNLASSMPELLDEMTAELKLANMKNFNPDRGVEQDYACMTFADNGFVLGPFLNIGGYYSKPKPELSEKDELDKTVKASKFKSLIRCYHSDSVRQPLLDAANAFWVYPGYAKQTTGTIDECYADAGAWEPETPDAPWKPSTQVRAASTARAPVDESLLAKGDRVSLKKVFASQMPSILEDPEELMALLTQVCAKQLMYPSSSDMFTDDNNYGLADKYRGPP